MASQHNAGNLEVESSNPGNPPPYFAEITNSINRLTEQNQTLINALLQRDLPVSPPSPPDIPPNLASSGTTPSTSWFTSLTPPPCPRRHPIPHDDPLVISSLISNYNVRCVLVDNGSSSDIIFLNAFKQLQISEEKLSPLQTPLVGFTRDQVISIGSIDLPITIGEYSRQNTKILTFLVVNCPSAYNVILGRTTLNAFQSVTSTYPLALKFLTDHGVDTVRGEQTVARECYVISLKEVKMKEAMIIEGLDVRDKKELIKGEPMEELIGVSINSDDPTKTAKISSQLSPHAKADLTTLLTEHKDVFAWIHADMLGIDPAFITHCLSIEPQFRPFRQKQRIFHPECNNLNATEVDKLLKAQFIRNADCPRWLSNVVLVRKNNGKWKLCVDYSDFNRACSKDSYPLPRIDLLVDATAGHQMLSFMDAFSGYN
ncbi:uncharacterized protein LOC114298916 [Camellia sinensis]|uniref:uncharacterized protein LOC114298916 n=1 Tax=Camellia sinensis TaxID=4442 RepID=UPI001035F6EC|nr:uncharacterized protein LOC114298916 [Camellia sinensis]